MPRFEGSFSSFGVTGVEVRVLVHWDGHYRGIIPAVQEKDFCSPLYKHGSHHYNARSFRGTGGIAQLGERLHGMQEVSGSIPLTSTKRAKSLTSLSSRGLGHRPFTAVTRVRISLGTPVYFGWMCSQPRRNPVEYHPVPN